MNLKYNKTGLMKALKISEHLGLAAILATAGCRNKANDLNRSITQDSITQISAFQDSMPYQFSLKNFSFRLPRMYEDDFREYPEGFNLENRLIAVYTGKPVEIEGAALQDYKNQLLNSGVVDDYLTLANMQKADVSDTLVFMSTLKDNGMVLDSAYEEYLSLDKEKKAAFLANELLRLFEFTYNPSYYRKAKHSDNPALALKAAADNDVDFLVPVYLEGQPGCVLFKVHNDYNKKSAIIEAYKQTLRVLK